MASTTGTETGARHRGRQRRDGTPVRVGVDPRQSPFQFTDHGLTQHVLDLLCIVVHVVRRDLGSVGEIKFP
jgi:hypothetical protein